jgi:NAD(P)-dependent dehydrogenase (short-subunit alcohol dehydrogenase family)
MTAISLGGRVVLVTGGSRGLGREMALALAAAGAKVAITGSAPTDALARTCADLGGDALAIAADVTDAAAARNAVDRTIAAFGRLDVLVNNAGLGMRAISETFNTVPTKFWEAPTNAWRAIVDTNVNGPFVMARAVVPQMLAQKFGKIINISTSDQTMVRRGYAPYGPSKAFLEAASRGCERSAARRRCRHGPAAPSREQKRRRRQSAAGKCDERCGGLAGLSAG